MTEISASVKQHSNNLAHFSKKVVAENQNIHINPATSLISFILNEREKETDEHLNYELTPEPNSTSRDI